MLPTSTIITEITRKFLLDTIVYSKFKTSKILNDPVIN